jgi:hypothetical protein
MIQSDEILLRQHGWEQGVKHLSVDRGEFLYLDPSTLRALIGDLERTLQIPLRDRELNDSFRNILAVAIKSLELASLNESPPTAMSTKEMPISNQIGAVLRGHSF